MGNRYFPEFGNIVSSIFSVRWLAVIAIFPALSGRVIRVTIPLPKRVLFAHFADPPPQFYFLFSRPGRFGTALDFTPGYIVIFVLD